MKTYRLVTCVTTLVSQGCLITPDKVSMPTQKRASTMNCQGLINVLRNKIIVPTLGAGYNACIELGGQCHQAVDSGCVRLPLIGGEGRP